MMNAVSLCGCKKCPLVVFDLQPKVRQKFINQVRRHYEESSKCRKIAGAEFKWIRQLGHTSQQGIKEE